MRLFSRSTLPEAKFEWLVLLMLTGVFLFWFVFSFCVFNLLHAFKSLALFPPSGKTVARYFGATSGLRVLCTRRPTQIRLRTKRKNEQESLSRIILKRMNKVLCWAFCPTLKNFLSLFFSDMIYYTAVFGF